MIEQILREGIFSVDESGAIWRVKAFGRTGKLRDINPTRADRVKSDGYRFVNVSVEGHGRRVLAHRLVWLICQGEIPEGLEINHKNGNRGDNRLENLELVTKSENLIHAYRCLSRSRVSGEKNGMCKLTKEKVVEIRTRLTAGESSRSIGRTFGVSHKAVLKIAHGESWRDQFPQAQG